MTKQKPIEIITPPNALKAKIGGPLPALDQQAIARAEAALAKLSDQFSEWIGEELEKLVQAWDAYESSGGTQPARDELHRRAHDLKGLAPTYGYPLVGRICASLCKLTGDDVLDAIPPMSLLKAHVDTVKAAVKGKIMSADDPIAVALSNELEMQMKKYVIAKG
jgi:HPt (histidine-containing phosphotransfer) domain-containing protein